MADSRMEDPDVLNYTQDIRQLIVDSLVLQGKVTNDPKELAILEKTLGSMDKQVFNKARQKSLDREIDNNEQAQQYIMELYDDMDKNRARFESNEGKGEIPEPELDEEPVDQGSLELGISDEGFEDFQKRMDD